MKKIYAKQRFKHLADWISLFRFILVNRGNKSYGASDLRVLVERHMMEQSSSLENLDASESALTELLNLLKITKVQGLKRLGATHDGGYIGISTDGTPFLLSGGAGKNIDFELELADNGSRVHLYDPTVRKLPLYHQNIHHIKVALTIPQDKSFRKSVTLSQALSTVNLEKNEEIWLKLDIEGSEIDLLSSDLEILPRFQQVFIEFHDIYKVIDPEYRRKLLNILTQLKKNFYLISINANNWKGFSNFGYAFSPVTFEATYLNRKYPIELSTTPDYKLLKRINNPRRLDIPDSPFLIRK